MKRLLAGAALILSVNPAYSEGDIDLHSDKFDVLRHVASEAAAEILESKPFVLVDDFGLGYSSLGDKPYPKYGFAGLEIVDAAGTARVLKLQLIKDESGWQFARVLDNDKIHQAHPPMDFESGHARTEASNRAVISAASSLEAWLNREALMPRVRSTAMSCYVSKHFESASCHGIYGLKADGETSCHTRSYLLEKKHQNWEVTAEIRYDQQVDYTSGELKTRKPFSKHC